MSVVTKAVVLYISQYVGFFYIRGKVLESVCLDKAKDPVFFGRSSREVAYGKSFRGSVL